MKQVYVVVLDISIMQTVNDIVDSVWTSKIKANKCKQKLAQTYGDDHVVILTMPLSK